MRNAIFCTRSNINKILEKENERARKTMIELDNGTKACMRFGMVETINYDHEIRERCPACRQETVVDFEKKMMTCENKKCRYFDKRISSIIKKRRRKKK